MDPVSESAREVCYHGTAGTESEDVKSSGHPSLYRSYYVHYCPAYGTPSSDEVVGVAGEVWREVHASDAPSESAPDEAQEGPAPSIRSPETPSSPPSPGPGVEPDPVPADRMESHVTAPAQVSEYLSADGAGEEEDANAVSVEESESRGASGAPDGAGDEAADPSPARVYRAPAPV